MLAAYLEPLDRLKLDGYVYPAIQMPPPDETMPQDGRVSEGPHSATSWVNMIGVPAVVVPAGFYASGLPFGLEFSARPWTDGDLLAIAYAWEQATRLRKPPTLVEQGLLAVTPARRREPRAIDNTARRLLAPIAMRRYFFSYTAILLIFCPCAFTPVVVMVRVFPSAEIT